MFWPLLLGHYQVTRNETLRKLHTVFRKISYISLKFQRDLLILYDSIHNQFKISTRSPYSI